MRKLLAGLLIGILVGLPVAYGQSEIERGSANTAFLIDGSVTAPSLTFAGDPNTGLYWVSSDVLGVTTGGAVATTFSTTAQTLSSAFLLQWGSSGVATPDTILLRDAANTVGQRNASTAQQFNVYNTYTSATSYERFSVDWVSNANVLAVGNDTGSAGGTGRVFGVYQEATGGGGNAAVVLNRNTLPFVQLGIFSSESFSSNDTTAGTGTMFSIGQATNTATSGSIKAVAIVPTYNQASGSADNVDLYINRTATAIGSGAQYILQGDVGGSAKFSFSHGGALAFRNKPTITVDGATTFALTGAANASSYVILACTGAETINTITGGVTGQILILENTDTDCTLTDNEASGADSLALTGSSTNDVGAAEKFLTFIYNGTLWYQVAESAN